MPESREDRLDQVIERHAQLLNEWDAAGKPTLIRTASLDMRPHPLLKLIQEHEEMIERMSRPIEAARGGRPVGSSSAPDRQPAQGPPKRARLEAVS